MEKKLRLEAVRGVLKFSVISRYPKRVQPSVRIGSASVAEVRIQCADVIRTTVISILMQEKNSDSEAVVSGAL